MSPMDGDENQAPAASMDATPVSGAAPLQVAFGSAGSVDPEGDDLSHGWDFGDGSPGSTEAAAQHLYTTPGTYTATLTVTDEHGASDSDSVELSVAAAAVEGGTPTPPTAPSTEVPQQSRRGADPRRRRPAVARCRSDQARVLADRGRGVPPACSTLPLGSTPAAAAPRARSRLGTARFSIRSGKSARVRVKVSPRGRRLLARHGKLTTSARAIAHDALLRKRTTSASLVLKQPARLARPVR